MGKINWIRAIGVGLMFGLIYTLAPKFIVGFFIGYMLMLAVIRIEELLKLATKPKGDK